MALSAAQQAFDPYSGFLGRLLQGTEGLGAGLLGGATAPLVSGGTLASDKNPLARIIGMGAGAGLRGLAPALAGRKDPRKGQAVQQALSRMQMQMLLSKILGGGDIFGGSKGQKFGGQEETTSSMANPNVRSSTALANLTGSAFFADMWR